MAPSEPPHDHSGPTRRAFLGSSATVLGLSAGAALLGATAAHADTADAGTARAGAARAGTREAGRKDVARLSAAVQEPEVFGTAAWDARPPAYPVSLAGNNPDKIIVHHTAFANTADAGTSGSFAVAHEIQDLHMDTNGWIDSGQHFTISRSGIVMEGRHRSLERLRHGSDMVVGAHTVGQNSQGIGIEGNGTYSAAAPPDPLYDSLVGLCAYICGQYALDPAEIYGHRDFNDTECPGDVLYGMLPRLRADVAGRL
ncbi:peptidoglycan recognition protein family protein [Actinacidiphila yeochonensis]|uniref:peptidoglycan recognition protein family protein n=1 Tax=Actinacidiphila yeochonensis TaxID=89050 RepID=UPI00068ABC84|nr:peptidoglycan recognition family protein [Actinacidiphila yeochonensis]